MRVISVGECMVEFFRQDDGNWRQGFAGDTMNVAWALRALTGDDTTVAYLTAIGTDGFSDRMVAFLAAAGMDTSLVARHSGMRPGLYTIETDDAGERRFDYWRSASAARHLADDGDSLAAAFARADLVYLSGITLAILPPDRRAALIGALGQRVARSFKVAFDPNIRPALWNDAAAMRSSVMAVAAAADMILPTFDDEAKAFDDSDAPATLARYAALGVPEVIVKDGVRPTLFSVAGQHGAVAVTPVARVIDTTGAGDSFNGGYLAARLRGRGVEAAVRVGQAISAKVVTARGALLPKDNLRDAAGLN